MRAALCAAVFAVFAVASTEGEAKPDLGPEWGRALEEGRRAEVETALARGEWSPAESAEAWLALGRPDEALVAASPALGEDPLAALLAGRAVLELDFELERDSRVEAALGRAPVEALGPVLDRERLRQRVLLAARRDDPAAIRELASRIPEAERDSEVRWLLASSLEPEARAGAELWDIWWETPGDPFALRARARWRELAAAGTVEAPPASVQERWAFARRLQEAGLHEVALDELAALPESESLGATVLAATARSAYLTRRNDECVDAFDRLRESNPDSRLAVGTGVWALRALRRSDSTEEIRTRAAWLVERFPGQAGSVLFQLGDHVANVRDPVEGLSILDRAAEAGGPDATDALWKGAWTAHRLEDRTGARSRMKELSRRGGGTDWEPAARYWAARWAEDAKAATADWSRVVELDPGGYYGRLARERLSRELPDTSAPHEKRAVEEPGLPDRAGPAMRRARALMDRGLWSLALLELDALERGSPSLELLRGRLALRTGRPDRAVAIAEIYLKRWWERTVPSPASVVWRLQLPLWPHPDTVAATDGSVDPFLVLAVARQESRFRTNAVSVAGALGLLQLMPETARRLAADLELPAPTRADLFRPELNVRLGVEELRRRLEDWDGAWSPALAAYNAGASVVRIWWDERAESVELDEWIDTIPYRETRLYVKRILENWALYHDLRGEPVSLLERLERDRGGTGEAGSEAVAAGVPPGPRASGRMD